MSSRFSGRALEIVQPGDGLDGVLEGGMAGDTVDAFAVDVHGAPVVQALDVVGPRSRHFQIPLFMGLGACQRKGRALGIQVINIASLIIQ